MSKTGFTNLPDMPVSTSPEDLVCYGFDASGLEGKPAMVAWPRSTEDISAMVRYASERNLPIVPRGAGSGMTAGSVPSTGAIVLSTERMNHILDVDEQNLTCVVEPGVINGRLQRALSGVGLFYPPDPASMNFCTLGGNVAENAGGPRALKYGVTRDYVMGLECVLPSGEVINTGVRTHKGVVGYDLTRLITGSEGTLVVLSKIRLRVLPEPLEITTLLAYFADIEAAGEAVAAITAARIIPRTLEFMDREAIRAVEAFKPTGLPKDVEALLLIELDGHPRAIEQEAARVVAEVRRLGGEAEVAPDATARERLWECRRSVSPALFNLGLAKISEDIVVPRSRMAEMLGHMRGLSERSKIKIVNFGHAGDGNIHVNILFERDDPDERHRAEGLVREIFLKVIELGGTISGEHGVGLTKAPYIGMEIKARELSLMRGIKAVFDPQGILNPGKIFG